MVTRINVDLSARLKERLVKEAREQRRSHRALVEMALERYFAELDRTDAAGQRPQQTA